MKNVTTALGVTMVQRATDKDLLLAFGVSVHKLTLWTFTQHLPCESGASSSTDF